MKRATELQISHMHDCWFKKRLIRAGAPATITDSEVAASAGFLDSRYAYIAGWQTGVEVQEDFLNDKD